MWINRLLAAALVLPALTLAACTQSDHVEIQRNTINGLPSVSAQQSGKAEWKVDAVDYENRSVALTNAEGVSKIFNVRSDAANLHKVKKGSTVKAEYSLALTASVRKVSESPSMTVARSTARGLDLEQKPGMLCERVARVEANVKAIDPNTRVVQLQLVGGDVMTFKADEKLQGLHNVHVGDQVVFMYAEAIKLSVD